MHARFGEGRIAVLAPLPNLTAMTHEPAAALRVAHRQEWVGSEPLIFG